MKRQGLAILLLALVLMLAFGSIAMAQSKSLYWQRYDVDIAIQTNGDFRVTETQELVFTSGTFQYGQRTINLFRLNDITDVSVKEENGRVYTQANTNAPYTFNVFNSNGQ